MSEEKIAVAMIRRKFPNPSSCPFEAREPSPNEYCVGGAFCLYVGYPARMALTGQRYDFPAAVSLAGAIQKNTKLKEWSDAYHNARFDDAWKKLGSILK